MDQLLVSLKGIGDSLADLGVRHALVGGLAVSAWGKARLTKDIDLNYVVGWLEQFEAALADSSLVSAYLAL